MAEHPRDPLTPGDHGDYTVRVFPPAPKPNGAIHSLQTGERLDVPEVPPIFTPTAFVYRDPSLIPRRECLYADHYFRKFASATVAPGGVGKSSLGLAEMVAMILKKEWLGKPPDEELRCWYLNGEDPPDEMERRIHAICQYYQVDAKVLEGPLCIESLLPDKLASYDRHGSVVINEAAFDALTRGIKARRIDVLFLDPWVSFHGLKESDNDGIDVVVKRLTKLAASLNIAVEIIHHTRKPPPGMASEMTVDDSRGASALISGVRAGRVLNRMSTKIAGDLGIEDRERRIIFRVDNGKGNLCPPDDAKWVKLASVPLPNSDNIQAAHRWKYPDAFAGVTTTLMHDIRHAVGQKDYRANAQSPNWVGHLVAERLRLKVGEAKDKATVKTVIKKWMETGVLAEELRKDEKGMERKFVVAGDWDGGEDD